jgi:glycosyltransferase involved in cell wall biosynthesis
VRIALVATHHVDYAANLALALAERHEVLFIVSRRSAARQLRAESWPVLASRLTLRVVPHHLAPLQPWIAWRCLHHIHRFAPDIVHVQEHPTRSMGMLAAWLDPRQPLVTTVHDPEPHSGEDARAAAVHARYNERLRRRSDGLVVHGPSLAAALVRQGFARERIAPIPHGVLRFGRHGDVPAPRVAPSPRRLILFGRMEAYKGLDTLVAAARLWREAGDGIGLTVAGAGPEIGRHQAALAALGVDLHAGRIGQAALEATVRGCAAAVLPYRDATQSGVAASAFGAGRPVIVTDVGELAGFARDAGIVIPPGDAGALAEAGRRLVTDATLRARLEAGVQARATGDLGWRSIGAETEAVYRRAVEKAPRSDFRSRQAKSRSAGATVPRPRLK